MDSFDKRYKHKERELLIYYQTKLLSELLLLNAVFSNNEYNGTTGSDLFHILQKKAKLSDQEKRKMIENATFFLKLKYQKKLLDFEKMEFETDY